MRSRAVCLPLRCAAGPREHVNSIQSRSRFNSIVATRQTTPTTSATIENRRSLSESINRTFVLSSSSQPRFYSSPSSSSSSAYHSAAPALQISVSFDAKIPPEELEHVDVLGDCVAVDPSMLALKPEFADGLPSLPHIKDDAIRQQVFTHRSVFARARHDFEDPPDDPAPDNEVLEYQGDAVLSFVITDIVRNCYPTLRVGPATKVRSSVIANANLANISVKYGLPQNLRLHRAHALALKTSVHNQGPVFIGVGFVHTKADVQFDGCVCLADVFEAYIGGLYNDQGLEVVRDWLTALLLPYVKAAYRLCRDQHGLPSPPPSPTFPDVTDNDPLETTVPGAENNQTSQPRPAASQNGIGHLSLFNQYLQQKRMIIEWQFDSVQDEGTKVTPIWAAHAIVNGSQLCVGRGSTKKGAQNEAAREGLVQLGITNPDE